MAEKMTRREFLGRAALTAVGLTVLGYNFAAYVPGPIREPVYGYPAAGWLETAHPNRPGLIYKEGGHEQYIRYFFENDPVIRACLFQSFNELLNLPASQQPKLLGDVLQKHMGYARNALKEKFPQYGEPSLGNIAHVALFSCALTYGPYLKFREIETLEDKFGNKLKIEKQGQTDDKEIYYLPDIKNRIPHIFPSTKNDCAPPFSTLQSRCLGYHRTAHLFQHMFLVHQYLYDSPYLQDRNRIPLGLKAILLLSKTKEEKAHAVSWWSGHAWEVLETFQDIEWWKNRITNLEWWRAFIEGRLKDPTKEPAIGNVEDILSPFVPTGLDDPRNVNDFAANELGFLAGVRLSRNVLTMQDVDDTINMLNLTENYQEYPTSQSNQQSEPVNYFNLSSLQSKVPVYA